MARVIEFKKAVRSSVPLMIGLCGPSGGGKTYSALRLASGIQRVTGGGIYMIDTEARRGLHYADQFTYEHYAFEAPFGPLDYLSVAEAAVKAGAKVIIVDSMSHEHEGPGGVLEKHSEETKRLAKAWGVSEAKAQMSAWAGPKAERRRMINTLLQLPCSSIFCFRAKEKLKITPGKDPQALGWMPIAGEEFIYEMTVNCLLLPKADGVPAWTSSEIGERATMKLPAQFRSLFEVRAPLSEDIGESLARWAEGGASTEYAAVLAEIAEADTPEALDGIIARLKASKDSKLNKAEKSGIGAAARARKEALAPPAEEPAAAGDAA